MSDFEDRVAAEIPSLQRYARSLTRDPEAAKDLLQDCLERALSRRLLWRPIGGLRPWLFRIMHNLHANAARAASRRPALVALDWTEDASIGEVQSIRAEAAEVMQAFAQLGPEYREVMLLIVVEGFSYREAAKVLGVPAGTIMSRMSRARERLQELLATPSSTRLRRVK